MAKFDYGTIMQTRGVYSRSVMDEKFSMFAMDCLKRHLSGDWGNIHPDDVGMNDEALISGDRLFSCYKTARETLWIITEADRSATTILFPQEY